MKKSVIVFALLSVSVFGFAQTKAAVSSPDGKVKFSLGLSSGEAVVSVEYKKTKLIDNSVIGFDFADGYFGKDVKITKGKITTVVDEYDLPVGKTSHVLSVSKQLVATLTDKSGRKVEMYLRAFDDGVAFRYVIPEQPGMDKLEIRNEILNIKPAGDPVAKALFMPGFHNSHEGLYTTKKVSVLDNDRLIDMPTLLSYDNGNYVSILEANLVDYAGMYLINKGGVLTSRLSPRLDRPELSVIADLPHRTPWRVFLVSDRAGALIESNILTTLCDPCEETDLSWIRPGKTTFTWWDDFQIPDTTWQRGNNFLSNKYYIDFAAENNLEYHSVYGYADMPWYIDDGPGFGLAGPNADLTRHDPRLDFPGICRYAQSRGVDMHVWLNWAALAKNIEGVFTKFNEWGVKGMMVDFMDRDDQEMIDFQKNVLASAMKHHLFIQFHGASKPSGLSRTYPSEFTREGTLNYENYKWDNSHMMGADHDLNMPFTRGLAGPADYHLGGFRAVPYDEFHPVYTRPTVTSTRCHMLAMYVVLDSYLNMVADAPEAYKNQPGFEFLRAVPTVWDETYAPLAEVDKYVVLTRRHGNEWYAGSINSSVAHDIELSLSFLGEGQYTMQLFTDADDVEKNPNNLVKTEKAVTSADKISIHLAPSGGFAARFVPSGR